MLWAGGSSGGQAGPCVVKSSMATVGRNEPCPCGSGKKFKRCHGAGNAAAHLPARPDDALLGRVAARRIQRERQQGLGKPIISADFQNQRFVAVGNRLFHSGRWRTFHDFLVGYISSAIGSAWGNAEIAKPPAERHPIIRWYQALCAHQRTFMAESGKVQTGSWTGAVAAYMHLAYDIYTLQHNAELQAILLGRLRNHERFTGARYETQVAAIFIRAGFDIAFENEQDGSTTHCEFTATHRRTGRQFSVEAKRRESGRLRVGRLFNGALAKEARHPRVVFIDLNMPDNARDGARPAFLEKVLTDLRRFEGASLNGNPRPPAYVFLTNTPWEHALDAPAPRSTIQAEGFQIPDFKARDVASLREAIDARQAHIEMHELINSMREHADVPSTFDGEIPEYAFNPDAVRIRIGERYMIPDADGVARPGLVTTAIVVEEWRAIVCGVTFDDGRSALCKMPATDNDIQAWRQHPDTMFGTVGQKTRDCKDPLELYDFFHEAFRRLTKEELLKALASAPDYAQLVHRDQAALASIHAERTANGALAMRAAHTGQQPSAPAA